MVERYYVESVGEMFPEYVVVDGATHMIVYTAYTAKECYDWIDTNG